MPGTDDDPAAVLREQVSELEAAADELAALVRSMTDVRVAMLVDVIGAGGLGAYELAKAEAARLVSWSGLTEARLDADEPEATPGGALRVGVLVGVTPLEPAAAVRGACAALPDRRWTTPAVATVPEHLFASWTADPPPSRGPARIEIHAGPGLATLTERRRRELFDDPAPPCWGSGS